MRNAVELAQAQVASEMQKSAVAKDSEIQALKAKLDAGEVARKPYFHKYDSYIEPYYL